MKTIFIIILVVLAGFLFGFLLVRLFIWISNAFLKIKAKKEALKKDSAFFFKNKPYNLKEMVEYDLKNYKLWYKNIFKRKEKGVSNYGRNDTGNTFKEQLSTDNGSNNPTNTDDSTKSNTSTA